MEPVNLSESAIYLIYTVKISLYSYYCYFFKLDFPYRSKSVKAVRNIHINHIKVI